MIGFYTYSCTAAYFYQPPTRQQQQLSLREKIHMLDIPGCSLLGVALLGVCLALTWSKTPYGWKNAHILVPFIVGWLTAAVLAAYAIWYRKDGFFHHGLYKGRNFFIVQVILACEGVALICANNYLAYQLSVLYNLDSWMIAKVFNIAWYAFLPSAIFVGWFITYTRRTRLAINVSLGGFLVYYILMTTTTLDSQTNIWGYNIFLGIGLGGAILGLNTVAQLSIPYELIASATGLLIATRTFGAAIGLVVFGAIFDHTLSSELVPSISKVALAEGLPASSLPALIQALSSHDPSARDGLSGVSQHIIKTSELALKHVYNHAFRNCYAAALGFVVLAMSGKS